VSLTSPLIDIPREPYVNAASAAEHLSISAKKLLTMARAGQVPAHGIGYGQRKMWRFLLSELDLWMQSEVTSGKPPRSSSGENS
jgi:hypothetical protein